MKNLVIFSDGGSRGNPGEAGCGFAIYKVEEDLQDFTRDIDFVKKQIKEIFSEGFYLGKATNNQAEWQGFLLALEKIIKNFKDCKQVRIYLDSELVVKQINGIYKVRNSDLKPLYLKVSKLLEKFDYYEVFHVYRKYNKRADELANEAMDKQASFVS